MYSVTNRSRSGKPTIFDKVQVIKVLQENQDIARINPLVISSPNAICHGLENITQAPKMSPCKLQVLFELKEADLAVMHIFSLGILAQIKVEPE